MRAGVDAASGAHLHVYGIDFEHRDCTEAELKAHYNGSAAEGQTGGVPVPEDQVHPIEGWSVTADRPSEEKLQLPSSSLTLGAVLFLLGEADQAAALLCEEATWRAQAVYTRRQRELLSRTSGVAVDVKSSSTGTPRATKGHVLSRSEGYHVPGRADWDVVYFDVEFGETGSDEYEEVPEYDLHPRMDFLAFAACSNLANLLARKGSLAKKAAMMHASTATIATSAKGTKGEESATLTRAVELFKRA